MTASLKSWLYSFAALCAAVGMLAQNAAGLLLDRMASFDHDGHHHTTEVISAGGMLMVTLHHEHADGEADDDDQPATEPGDAFSARHTHGDHVLVIGSGDAALRGQPPAAVKCFHVDEATAVPDRGRVRCRLCSLPAPLCAARPPPLPPGWMRMVRRTVMLV